MSKDKKKKNRAKKKDTPIVRDKFLLYSAAVQSVDADIDFFRRIYRRKRGKHFRTLREDFCGTAALACDWVRRNKEHRAWGIDLDKKTLEWGRKRYVSSLGPAAERIELLNRNVLEVDSPKVDIVAALNFSYCVFKTREQLRDYFRVARRSLAPGGMFFVDIFGGTEAICEDRESRKITTSEAFDGTKVPTFKYIWDQARFNPVDHHILCYIHFKLADGTRIKRAFTYDWRLWTLPEIQELMLDAGFAGTEVYTEGWDEEADDTDGIFRRRKRFENQDGWVAYVVGLT
jgi:SAM-dependent methyltransferase